MGHEILAYEGRSAVINDAALWLLRHFALEQLRACSGEAPELDDPLPAYFSAWTWVGPGVYLNLDLPTPPSTWLTRLQPLLERVRARLEAFGAVVPLDYVQSQIQGGLCEWIADIPTAVVLDALGEFERVAVGPLPDAGTTEMV